MPSPFRTPRVGRDSSREETTAIGVPRNAVGTGGLMWALVTDGEFLEVVLHLRSRVLGKARWRVSLLLMRSSSSTRSGKVGDNLHRERPAVPAATRPPSDGR